MAREFVSNDSISNTNGITGLTVDNVALFAWINPNAVATARCIFTTGQALGAGTNGPTLSLRATTWAFNSGFTTTDGRWDFGTSATSAWASLGISYDRSTTTSDPDCYENGSLQTESEGITPVGSPRGGIDTIRIGEFLGLGGDQNGAISFVCYWAAQLSAEEHLSLYHGVNPFVIRNESLVLHYPLYGNNSPEENHAHPTETGTVTGTSKASRNAPVELLENYL